jgi:hypothetical protein
MDGLYVAFSQPACCWGSLHGLAKPQSRERQAKKACLSGDYAKGVSILSDLFLETGDATYLCNQGSCYE